MPGTGRNGPAWHGRRGPMATRCCHCPITCGTSSPPLPALTAAAAATTVIRLSTFILANDLRHPVVLAKEIATLDVLAGGRVELGLGAGWSAAEFHAMGIPFDPAAVRIDRLSEAVTILRALLSGEPTTFSGRYYRLDNVTIRPWPAQAAIPLV